MSLFAKEVTERQKSGKHNVISIIIFIKDNDNESLHLTWPELDYRQVSRACENATGSSSHFTCFDSDPQTFPVGS